MAKEKKINIQKLIKKHKKHIFSFQSKGWSITIFMLMAVFAYFTQAYLDARFNPSVVQANVVGKNGKAMEAFKINEAYNIFEVKDEIYFATPGATDTDAFAFGISSKNETLIFKSLTLNLLGENVIRNARLLENDNVISEARIKNNEINFLKFSSILQPENSKIYKVQVEIEEEVKSGARFKLQILNPYSLSIYLNEEIDYSLGAYPIDGAYVSVVGWRK